MSPEAHRPAAVIRATARLSGADGPERPEIRSSWNRSELSGVDPAAPPTVEPGDLPLPQRLLAAASTVLDEVQSELTGSRSGVILADCASRVVDVRPCDDRLRRAMSSVGVLPGVRFGEDNMGTNAIGTSAEIRGGLSIIGAEHFNNAFKGFSCYAHPIRHPLTHRFEGILDISCPVGAETTLFGPLVRRLVQEIEDRLQADSPRSLQRLVGAFQAATSRSSGRVIVALGKDLVLSSPAALDLLSGADYATLRAYAAETTVRESSRCRLTLSSGQVVGIRDAVGEDGALIEILPAAGARPGSAPVPMPDLARDCPVLVVGEAGTGRTTRARRILGPGSVTIDALDIVTSGERAWACRLAELFAWSSPLVVENVQLLSESLTGLLVRHLRTPGCRPVVMTTTPGEHLSGVHSPLEGICVNRCDLMPLRLRRQEIPAIAQDMLASLSAGGARLTPTALGVLATQRWAGNLTELQRVVEGLAGRRSAGDIQTSDIPESHRKATGAFGAFDQAEADVIDIAIRNAAGNKLLAAKALGVSRSTLYNKMRALKLEL